MAEVCAYHIRERADRYEWSSKAEVWTLGVKLSEILRWEHQFRSCRTLWVIHGPLPFMNEIREGLFTKKMTWLILQCWQHSKVWQRWVEACRPIEAYLPGFFILRHHKKMNMSRTRSFKAYTWHDCDTVYAVFCWSETNSKARMDLKKGEAYPW